MNKAWYPLAALPLLACCLQAVSPAISEIPLPEKIYPGLDAMLRSAVLRSPRMVSRSIELEMAENDRIAARSNLLPTLSGYYGYNVVSQKQLQQPASTSVKTPYSLTLSQPLFFWGERNNNDKIGAINLKISQGQYRQGYRLLAQELRSSYLRLIVQKLALKRARFYQQYVSNQLKLQEDRLLKKVISEVEISGARLNAEQAQISLERTEFDYANAKLSFARLAGLDTIEDEAVPDEIAVTAYAPGPFDQLLSDYLAEKEPASVEAFNLRQQIEIANLNYANAKTRLRPKVSAVAGLSQDEESNYLGGGIKYTYSSQYVGLSVNWTIFDGFAAGAATRNALTRRRMM
jgi:outer membrane protein TolC